MYENLKKSTTSLVTSLLACTIVCAAEPGNKGILNPPAQPYARAGIGMFSELDILLWKAHEDGLNYATKTNFETLTGGQFIGDKSGSVKNPDFDWDVGLSFGIGWNPQKDGWNLFLNWTHLHTNAGDHTTANTSVGARILPEFLAFNLPDLSHIANTADTAVLLYNQADSHWKLQFNTLDFEVGREFFVSRRLTLRPNFGLRAAWIHQKYDVNAQGVRTDSFSANESVISKVDMTNNFNGIGPRIGFDTRWILGAGFSIFGDAAVALLLGEFKNKYESRATVTPVGDDPLTGLVDQNNLKETFHDTRACVDLAVGLSWERKFYDNRYRIQLQAGWDQHLFFEQNQFISYETLANTTGVGANTGAVLEYGATELVSQTRRRGDLSLQGVTFSARLDF